MPIMKGAAKDKVLEYLKKTGDSSFEDIREALELDWRELTNVLQTLSREGKIWSIPGSGRWEISQSKQ